MHGVGCSGKDELGDSPGEERVSMPLSELKTANKRDSLSSVGACVMCILFSRTLMV
jgi:hypothetical protein